MISIQSREIVVYSCLLDVCPSIPTMIESKRCNVTLSWNLTSRPFACDTLLAQDQLWIPIFLKVLSRLDIVRETRTADETTETSTTVAAVEDDTTTTVIAGATGIETITVRAIGGDEMMIETTVTRIEGDQTGETMIDVEKEGRVL